MIPLVVVMIVLHLLIIVLIIEVNRSEDKLTELMANSGTYQQTATNLQAGTSTLSETATSYAQMPVTPAGEANVGPLMAYVEELGNDRRGKDIVEAFNRYDIGDEAKGYIKEAAEKSDQMMEIQIHVIAILRSVYPTPSLEGMPEAELTEEEKAMPEEARVGYAKQLIMSKDYSSLKYGLSEAVGKCHEAVQKEIEMRSAETRKHIDDLRTALWAVVFTIIGTLVGTFILYYRWIIHPLRIYASKISADQEMEQKSILREMRVLVDSYNTLRARRNKLETILRRSAETDALTGMPNRASFESTVVDFCDEGGPLAVVVFDVNFLKETNDTEGHLAGDRLIRTAADCIHKSFGANCYRIGGDEFAALLRVNEEEVRARVSHFEQAMEREKISVAYGWVFAAETDYAGFRKLLEEADKRMYEQKKRVHGEK